MTYGEAFTVQPFANNVDTMTLTGAQLDAHARAAVRQPAPGANRILLDLELPAPTPGAASAPMGDKVSNIAINGVAVDPAATYRVAENSFLATGGDNFTGFTAGTGLITGAVDLDALNAYLAAHSPVAPPALDRITLLP